MSATPVSFCIVLFFLTILPPVLHNSNWNCGDTGLGGDSSNAAEPTMFYACLAIVLMVLIMFGCLAVSIVDLERYNFGLYIVLLCIIGIMLACALCIANPTMCSNPRWYVHLCAILNDMGGEREQAVAEEAERFTGGNISSILRNAKQAAAEQQENEETSTTRPGRKANSRATGAPALVMLAPAMHIMNGIWKGMAWVAEDMDDEEEEEDDDEEDEEEDESEQEYTSELAGVVLPKCHGMSAKRSRQNSTGSRKKSKTQRNTPGENNCSTQPNNAPATSNMRDGGQGLGPPQECHHHSRLASSSSKRSSCIAVDSADGAGEPLLVAPMLRQHARSISSIQSVSIGGHFSAAGSSLSTVNDDFQQRHRLNTSISEGRNRLMTYLPSHMEPTDQGLGLLPGQQCVCEQ